MKKYDEGPQLPPTPMWESDYDIITTGEPRGILCQELTLNFRWILSKSKDLKSHRIYDKVFVNRAQFYKGSSSLVDQKERNDGQTEKLFS